MNNISIEKVERKDKKVNKITFILIILFILASIIIVAKLINTTNVNYYIENNISDFFEVTEKSSMPDEVQGIKVHTDLLEKNTEKRTGIKRKIKYIVIHETDNYSKTANAKNHAVYLKSKNNESATSWHYTVDEKEIYHHIPDNEIANHAGTYEGNRFGIGIELCVNEGSNFNKTMENAAKLVAYLLKEYNFLSYF